MKKDQKHLIFITPAFPQNEQELDCVTSVQTLVEGFKINYPSLKISVISLHYPHFHSYKWHNIPVYSLGANLRKYHFRLVLYWRVFKAFKRIYNPAETTVINCFWVSESTFIGKALAKYYGLKLVANIYGQDARKTNKYLKILPLKSITITCGSEQSAATYQRNTGLKVDHIIPRGLDDWRWQNLDLSGERPIDIIGVGNLCALKNYTLFVQLIHDLKADFPQIKAVILGEGEDLQQLQSLADSLGISENISLLGAVSREKVLEKMTQGKIFLHTSKSEGQAYVLLEALFCGQHVVTTDVGRLEHSRLFVGKNRTELKQHLSRLLSQKLDTTAVPLPAMSDTVKQYYQVFFKEL